MGGGERTGGYDKIAPVLIDTNAHRPQRRDHEVGITGAQGAHEPRRLIGQRGDDEVAGGQGLGTGNFDTTEDRRACMRRRPGVGKTMCQDFAFSLALAIFSDSLAFWASSSAS